MAEARAVGVDGDVPIGGYLVRWDPVVEVQRDVRVVVPCEVAWEYGSRPEAGGESRRVVSDQFAEEVGSAEELSR